MAEPREKPLILVVDDEPFNVDLLQQELEDMGYDSIVAYDGQEALERVAEQAPDAILLDVMMPVLDGFKVCARLKEDPETALIPIIIMTALSAIDDRIQGIEAGADDFLTKPVDDRELKARLQTALRMKRALDARMHRLHETGRQLAKFVPDVVRRKVAENPSNPGLEKKDLDATVLFLDIVGYTVLSEKLSPSELTALTERYFSRFLDRIHDWGGMLSETSGDGMMVVFVQEDPKKHAEAAVQAGLDVFRELAELNRGAVHPIALHIGVNSGRAAVGSTQYRGQSGERWVFTADGLMINVGARLASFARAGEIIIGPETARRVSTCIGIESCGPQRLKNVEGALELFRVFVPETHAASAPGANP